jgi:hypothetical protein
MALGACAWRKGEKRERWTLIFSALALLFIFGRIFAVPVVTHLVEVLPVLKNIGCQYWWAGSILPLVVLVGYGVHNLRMGFARIMPLLVVIAIGVVTVGWLWVTFGLHKPHLTFKICSLILFLGMSFGVPALVRNFRSSDDLQRQGKLALFLLGFMFFELMVYNKAYRVRSNDVFNNPPKEVMFVKERVGTQRTMTIGPYGIRPELGMAFQIAEVSSLNQGVFPSYLAYFNEAAKLDPKHGFSVGFAALYGVGDKPELDTIDWKAFDLLGVKYVLVANHYKNYRQMLLDNGFPLVLETPIVAVYENPNVISRAFSLSESELKPELKSESGHATKLAAIDSDIELPQEFRSQLIEWDVHQYHNAHVILKGKEPAASRSVIVLTDTWHKNWSAEVDGVETPVVKVNGVFRGVHVPAGARQVEFRYRPKTLDAALIISPVTFGVLMVLLVLESGLLRRKRLVKGTSDADEAAEAS